MIEWAKLLLNVHRPRRAAARYGALGAIIATALALACAAPAAKGAGALPAQAPPAAVNTWSVGGGAAVAQVALPVAAAAEESPPATTGNALPEYVGPIRGRFLERWFDSAALERSMRYFIYLPPGYDASGRLYPVLYLLHGASGEAEEWAAYGFLNRLDAGILAGTLNPFIAVLPEGEFGYWINHADEGYRWGDYLTHDVVADVDANFRTRPAAAARAVGGLSMGGAGGLVQAFTYPSVFGVVGAHSPSLREDNSVVPFLGEGAEFAERDPLSLARTRDSLDRLRIWLDIGEADQFYPRALALHATLNERGVAHEWHAFPGEHYDGYWIEHTPDYLGFYSRALGNNG
ncbi:MAG TPA: alpha/beta hydrolase-fold protein [Chloroflexota bacterium]|nr:alpha/beta hydrolase-fold protein [Chloroflexota bacterium]